ncbi:MAG: hypothetical protein GKR90_13225 [Pseudomonadales bacterium]|nr:hypothetical protein [Pseudomonadales bacterium]
MRRLYYISHDIETTEAISRRLHEEGISDWNFHVLAKDPSGLYSHHIHSALPHHHKDIIRTGEVGALYGLTLSFGATSLVLVSGAMTWISSWFDIISVTTIGALLGALVGIKRGLSRQNHRLATFQEEIEAGRYLIMVDVRREDKAQIRELMNMEFRAVTYGGNESTIVRPFKRSKHIRPEPISSAQQQV